MAFDPNTAELDSGTPTTSNKKAVSSFDPETAEIEQSQPTQQQKSVEPGIPEAFNEAMTFDPLGKAKSFGVAAANSTADVLTGVADMPTYILSKIPGINKYITPDVANEIYKDNKKGFDLIRPNQDTTNQAKQNPMSYGVGYAAPYLAGNVGAYGVLEKATRIPQATSGLASFLTKQPSQLASAALTSTIGADTQEQKDYQALLGMGGTAVLNSVGSTVTGLAGKLGIAKKELKEVVSGVKKDLQVKGYDNFDDAAAKSIATFGSKAKEIENANFETIKSIPGTIDKKLVQSPLLKLISTESLDKPQIQVIQDTVNRVAGLQTMDDALKLKQDLSTASKLFTKQQVSPETYNTFKELRTAVDGAIGIKAKQAGLGTDWDLAKKFHGQVIAPLQEFGVDDIIQAVKNKDVNPTQYNEAISGIIQKGMKSPQALRALLTSMGSDGSEIVEKSIIQKVFKEFDVNPESANLSSSLRNLNNIIAKFNGVLSKRSIDTLKGVRDVMVKGGIETTPPSKMTKKLAEYTIGGTLGATTGAVFGGPAGAAVGSAIGIGSAGKVHDVISKLLQSDTGLFILHGVGAKAPWANKARKTILDMIKLSPNEATTIYSKSNQDIAEQQ